MKQPGDPWQPTQSAVPATALLELPFPRRIKRLHKTKEGSLLP